MRVAECLQRLMPGLTVEVAGEGLVIQNRNQFGSILLAWYVSPEGAGSKIDVRRAQKIAPGIKRAEQCF